MDEQEKRKKRCCFTGHRPEKLGVPSQVVKAGLERAIDEAIRDGYRTFISGMSRGTDIWAAQIVLDRKRTLPDLRLILAIPYPYFESRWGTEWQYQYRQVLSQADLVRYIQPSFSRSCFQQRNMWMVLHASRVIAVYNGSVGGTRNTIEFALRKNVDVRSVLNMMDESCRNCGDMYEET